jgi:hypothetical protein
MMQTYPLQYFFAFNVEDPKFALYRSNYGSLAEAKEDGSKGPKQNLAVLAASPASGDKESAS